MKEYRLYKRRRLLTLTRVSNPNKDKLKKIFLKQGKGLKILPK